MSRLVGVACDSAIFAVLASAWIAEAKLIPGLVAVLFFFGAAHGFDAWMCGEKNG